ncbi:MAG: thiamine-phosphate kinase [archaeon]|nr:thiamine-phosphate kinase [archaeon]
MATLKEVGERALVENIRGFLKPRSKTTRIGPGDDAAVIKGGSDGSIVISTDVLTKERHFPEGMTYEQFGWSAAAVSFSDIASMGARPLGFVSAITLPEDTDESQLYDIVSGIDQCCELCGTDIVGGDTKFGSMSVAGTAFGTMDGRSPLTRSGAKVGDIVAVTGTLGNAAAGFYAIENGIEADDQIFALMVPVPRVEDGMNLSKSGVVHSCMDLSDGLANAMHAVCAASHVGMEVEWEFLPVEDDTRKVLEQCGKDVKHTVMEWGGDYELMFTFDRNDIKKLYDLEVPFSIIGVVTEGDTPYLSDGNEKTEVGDGVY